MGQVFGCTQVKQSTMAVRERFGRFDGVLEPGFHCVPWCFGHRIAGEVSLRVQHHWQTYEVKTKDDVSVQLTTSIQYRQSPDNIENSFYKLKDTTTLNNLIRVHTLNVIKECVLKLELAVVFEQKNTLEKAVQEKLDKAMSAYGYQVLEIVVTHIIVPKKKAMDGTAGK